MPHITRIRRIKVSTHSRPKAAGAVACLMSVLPMVSTHSRPKAAGVDERKSD